MTDLEEIVHDNSLGYCANCAGTEIRDRSIIFTDEKYHVIFYDGPRSRWVITSQSYLKVIYNIAILVGSMPLIVIESLYHSFLAEHHATQYFRFKAKRYSNKL